MNSFGGTPAIVQTGQAVAGLAGGAADGGGSGLLGGITSLFSASKWVDFGKNLWSGFTSTASQFWNGDTMMANNLAQMPGYYTQNSGILGTSYGGSSIGQALGVLGGIYAGWNRA